VDSEGKLVGINVCAAWRGVTYSVPWAEVEKVLPSLRKGEDVEANGFIGVQISDAHASLLEGSGAGEGGGVLVREVIEGHGAKKGGMLPGDIITHINGERVCNVEHLRSIVPFLTPGEDADVRVLRIKSKGDADEELVDLKVTVGKRPEKSR
jgi:S1-C subfamily serine protease